MANALINFKYDGKTISAEIDNYTHSVLQTIIRELRTNKPASFDERLLNVLGNYANTIVLFNKYSVRDFVIDVGITFFMSGWTLVVKENDETLYSGLASLFQSSLISSSLKNLPGKVIRFDYSGGTENGLRLVKVESVENSRNGYSLIRGVDVVKGDTAIRCYRSDKINGKIEVTSLK